MPIRVRLGFRVVMEASVPAAAVSLIYLAASRFSVAAAAVAAVLSTLLYLGLFIVLWDGYYAMTKTTYDEETFAPRDGRVGFALFIAIFARAVFTGALAVSAFGWRAEGVAWAAAAVSDALLAYVLVEYARVSIPASRVAILAPVPLAAAAAAWILWPSLGGLVETLAWLATAAVSFYMFKFVEPVIPWKNEKRGQPCRELLKQVGKNHDESSAVSP